MFLTYQLTDTITLDLDFQRVLDGGRETFGKFFDLIYELFPAAKPVTDYLFPSDDPDEVFDFFRFLTLSDCSQPFLETILKLTKDIGDIRQFLHEFADYDEEVLIAVLENKTSLVVAGRFLNRYEFLGEFCTYSEFAEWIVRDEVEDKLAELLIDHLDLHELGHQLIAEYKYFLTPSGTIAVFQ